MKLTTLSDTQRGELLVTLGAVFLGLGYSFRKLLLIDKIDPFVLFGISAVVTSAFILGATRVNWLSMWGHFKSRPFQSIFMSCAGTFGGIFFLLAIDHLGLGVASVLEKIQPLFVLFLAAFFLHETLPRKALMWVPVALAASYCVCNPNPLDIHLSESDPVGIIYVLAASTCWAISTILGRLLVSGSSAIPPSELTAIRGVLNAMIGNMPLLFVPSVAFHLNLDPAGWALLLLGPGAGIGIGLILYFRGLRHVTAPVANFLEMSTPVVGVTFGYFLVGERMTVSQMAAIPLLFLSVICIANARAK